MATGKVDESVAGTTNPQPGVAATAARAGVSWSIEECVQLMNSLRAGTGVNDIAARLERTPGAIKARLCRMIPRELHIHRDGAAGWLLARFAADPDYDWPTVMATGTRQHPKGTGAPDTVVEAPTPSAEEQPTPAQQPRPRRRAAEPAPPDEVLRLWQGIVGATLPPARAEQFLTHADLPTLRQYPLERIRAAGEQLHRRSGQLRIAQWVYECAWGGGGTVTVQWAQIVAPGSDAAIGVGELLTAAISGLPNQRRRRVLTERLGLHGDTARTLQAIGEDLGVTRERVRQLQESVFTQLRRRSRPPTPAQHVGRILTDVLAQASTVGVDLPHGVLTLIEAATPTAPVPIAVRTIAALLGRSEQTAKHLAAEVTTLAAVRRAELARTQRDAAAVERATQRAARLLLDVEWPAKAEPAPDRSHITPLRGPSDRDGAGTWPSMKLARAVAYDSATELGLIKTLDQARQITWFCEQPVAIGYTFDGRHHTYYPDLLAVTDDGRCVLIEVKNQLDMALGINQAKRTAAVAFCTRHGWGYLCTDGHRTLRTLHTLPVPQPAVRELTDALTTRRHLMWADTEPIRQRHAITGLHLAALAVQHGWDIRLSPYRVSAATRPQTSGT